MTARYDRVRFIGYAIPTTPAEMIAIGNPDGPGAVAGTYRAIDDLTADVQARAGILKAAVDTAKAALPTGETGVLNVFVAAEFFWHGPMGPYVHAPDEPDPADVIQNELAQLFPAATYPDFLLVLGTAVTAQVADIGVVMGSASTTVRNDIVRALSEGWLAADGPLADIVFDSLVNLIKNGHAYPQVEVRNRALVFGPAALTGFAGTLDARAITTEKYFDSDEDFVLWDVTGKPVITEQMTAYRVLDTSGGDFKRTAVDPYAIFRVGGSDAAGAGVEICLDHSDHRLRKGVARSPWPERDNALDLHLIPSCGMQLHPASVAARAGGWAFNCDRQYPLGAAADAGAPQRGTVGGIPSAYTDYVDAESSAYGAHTQLARIRTGPRGADPRAVGARDAAFEPAPEVDVTVIPLPAAAGLAECFAGGPGALHIYGKEQPPALG